MTFTTAGLSDSFGDEVEAAEPILINFGGLPSFCGSIVTLDLFEDCGLIYDTLQAPGRNKVLVVDGGGSLQRALVGEELAQTAEINGWQGIILYGCVRNVARLERIAVGVYALAAAPLAAVRRGRGNREKPVHFAGITFRDGHFVYADRDGILISARDLLSGS